MDPSPTAYQGGISNNPAKAYTGNLNDDAPAPPKSSASFDPFNVKSMNSIQRVGFAVFSAGVATLAVMTAIGLSKKKK